MSDTNHITEATPGAMIFTWLVISRADPCNIQTCEEWRLPDWERDYSDAIEAEWREIEAEYDGADYRLVWLDFFPNSEDPDYYLENATPNGFALMVQRAALLAAQNITADIANGELRQPTLENDE